MVMEETGTEVAVASANGTCLPEIMREAVTSKEEEDKDEVKEMEEDSKEDEKAKDSKMGEEDHGLKEEKEIQQEGKKGADDVNMEDIIDMKEEKEKEIAENKAEESNVEKEKAEERKVEKEETEESNEEKEETEESNEEKEEAEVSNEEKEEAEDSKVEKDEIKESNVEKDEIKESNVETEEAEESKVEKEKVEEIKEEKRSKKRRSRRSSEEMKVTKKRGVDDKKANEPTTPVPSSVDRPVRERKSVERLVVSIEKEGAKEFLVEKGRGTPLKDIPNVAYKLSRRKIDDSLKLLHTILFGRRGKAIHFKSNISKFSGFVWHENEEKQKLKVKEKFDKCIKEKLLEFCDVFDIPVAKTTTRKEDIVMKLIDFLAAPHATTDVLLAEKEQSSKARKRKRVAKRSPLHSGGTSAKHSKKRLSEGTPIVKEKNSAPETDEESEQEEKEEENGVPDEPEEEVPEHSESEENDKEKDDESEEESEEDTGKHKHVPKKSSSEKESAGKSKTKTVNTHKRAILAASPKKPTSKSSSKHSKVDNSSDAIPKVFSRKKKSEEPTIKKSTRVRTPAKEKIIKDKTGKKVTKGKDKVQKESGPNEEELRNRICEILKEVDFNTATFTDILKQLARHYDTDFTPRKADLKLLIQEELTKLANEAEENEDDEDDEDAEKEEDPEPAGKEVET